mmetsp:Transcript_51146/g.100488  ORF Transcript_51146/g.100488 Transcript_51146/m.100488 type:complete len:234 (-) Transcript_51146:356-1057(-)
MRKDLVEGEGCILAVGRIPHAIRVGNCHRHRSPIRERDDGVLCHAVSHCLQEPLHGCLVDSHALARSVRSQKRLHTVLAGLVAPQRGEGRLHAVAFLRFRGLRVVGVVVVRCHNSLLDHRGDTTGNSCFATIEVAFIHKPTPMLCVRTGFTAAVRGDCVDEDAPVRTAPTRACLLSAHLSFESCDWVCVWVWNLGHQLVGDDVSEEGHTHGSNGGVWMAPSILHHVKPVLVQP